MERRSLCLLSPLALVVASAGAVLGCSDGGTETKDAGDDDVAFVTEGSDTAAAETDAQLITSSLVSSSPGGAIGLASQTSDGNLATRAIGDGALAIYFPRGCLQVASDTTARTARYTFDHCIGPNGLRAVTGVVTATYEASPSQLHLELTASQLSVNRATVDWTATADITATGGDRTMKWKAQLSGTTAGGRTFERINEHAISWTLGEACFALEGSSNGRVNGREIRTEIENFRRCRKACPDAGGKVVVTNVAKNKRFELNYDGTNRATFVGPEGRVVSIPLLCGQ
ncbi:MAG TPA: hypothetical protein VM925_29880 [Labilithrix sp.]|nr:hypothetical protein [Labilithrix sp.]